MVIYITGEQHKDLLTRMAERYEWELLVEVTEKISLNTFISNRLQVINSIRYLVIERSCVKENEQQLRDLLDTVLAIWTPQIILIEENLQDNDGEYQKVIYGDNITSLYKYQDNLEENIEYLLKGEKIPAENVYSGTWIGVMSANSGAGCTHVAIHLANYIASQGQSVCYVEANESGDLGAMAPFYEFEQFGDNHYHKDGVDYWHQMIDPEKKFAVLDIGKYSAVKMEMFNQCKIKILITDGKPYRMADALSVLRYTKDDTTRLWLNYIKQEEYEKIHEVYLADVLNPIDCISWHRSMFEDADVIYQELLKIYIPITTKKTSRFSFMIKPETLKGRIRNKKTNLKLQEDNIDKINLENTLLDENITEEERVEEFIETVEDTQEEAVLEGMAHESIGMELKDLEQGNSFMSDPETDYSNSELVSFEDLEQEVFVVESKKKAKRNTRAVKNMLMTLLLIAGIGIVGAGALYIIPIVKEDVFKFVFNNQGQQQEVTELVDQDLNINQDIKISVLEVEGADGYEVSYSTDWEFSEERTVVVEVEIADKAVESLTAGKTYYVRVRAFKFNENGTKVYGEYTEIQKIQT